MNIQPYIDQLNEAKNGAEMRHPIASVLKLLYDEGKDAKYLVGTDGVKRVAVTNYVIFDSEGSYKPGDQVYDILASKLYLCVEEHTGPWNPRHFEEIKVLARKDEFTNYIPLDAVPTHKSNKLVKSIGIYSMIGDLSSLEVS